MSENSSQLHPAQKDVYIDQLIDLESPHYNIGFYIVLKGKLNRDNLYESMVTSPQMFDALQMRFDLETPDFLCHYQSTNLTLSIPEVDFSQKNNARDHAQEWMQASFNTPFTLNKKSEPFAHYLIKIAGDEHWLVFKYHHLVTDLKGLVVLLNHIAKKYNSLSTGEQCQFSYPHYKDAAIEANDYYNSADYQIHRNYWTDKLSERPHQLLQKKFSLKNPDKRSSTYAFDLSNTQRAQVEHVQHITKSSLQRLTIAALLIYFGKTSSLSDFLIGVPVHKRNTRQQGTIVGMFSGVLPYRGSYKPDVILIDLLNDISCTQRANYRHQSYLYGDLSRDLKINPFKEFLCEVMVNYELLDFDLNFGKEIKATVRRIRNEAEREPIQFSWQDYGSDQDLRLQIQFSHEYFTRQEVDLLAQRLISIIEQFPRMLSEPISSIDVLPAQEQMLLMNFTTNTTSVNYPQDKSLVDLFEAQALASPDAVAVVYENQELSYKQLNEQSNQLAHYLRMQGVTPEMLVPICLKRSMEMIVGILGILKAGGAYVPIDPAYPVDRINYILEDIGGVLVVSSHQSTEKLQTTVKFIVLDSDWPLISRQSVDNLPTRVLPEQLAYVIYTSGSTGKPKGVMIEHKGAVASTLSRNIYYENNRSELLLSSYSFDSSVATIFGILSAGGKLILCRDELIKDVDHIRKLLKRSDSILCVPSYYNFLLEENLLDYSPVSRVIVAGERLNPALVDLHYQKTINVSLCNEYGPTENTVWTTVAKIESVDDLISIGKPISNVKVYILDGQNRFSPIGIKGEIYIGGIQIARGYLNRSDLTQKQFSSDPFSTEPGSRMYKTGDLGRWLPDGNIEYLGRVDDQVKIRGYRIELGEIESVLQKSGLVHQAVVLAQEDRQGTNRLVGYVVVEGEFEKQRVVSYLTKELPEHMIPALWVTLERLPLTPNGKIDKKALSTIERSDLSTNKFVGPWNELEERLARMWQSMLQIERVGRHENFFELGGHSLLAMRIVARIRRELAVDITIKDLFINPTIAELAGDLEVSYKKKIKSLIPIKISGNRVPFYIVCGAGGTVFSFREFAAMLDPDQPVYGLQHPTDYKSLQEFPDTIEGIAALYIEEILLENPNGPYALSGHCLGGFVAFEMARQLKAMGKNVSMLALFDTVVTDLQKNVPSSFANSYHLSAIVKKSLSKALLKIKFELFLLINHPTKALQYKVNKVRSMVGINQIKIEDMDVLNTVSSTFIEALKNYDIKLYKGDLFVFYAKEHYYFVDRANHIFYKAVSFSDGTKKSWNRYAESVKIYEVEGEHSVMFDPEHATELARLIQSHLNESLMA